MNEKISLTRVDNSQIQADLICYIENNATGKRYLYYTLNETVGDGASGTVKVYVAKISQGNPSLDTPITEEDWGQLKGYMSDALKGNTNPAIKYVPTSELVNPTVISEKAIAMPTSYDYINKQRGIYAETVATMAASEPTPAPQQETPAVPPQDATQPVTPDAQPQPAEPAPTVEQPVSPQPAAPIAETPEAVPAPPITPAQEDTSTDASGTSSAVLEPIDLNAIEAKYAEMIETINKLKSQELEAAKRFNATIELSAMHKEQHANYVQSEQVKESVPIAPAPTEVPQAALETPAAPVAPTPAPEAPQAPTPGPVPMAGSPIEPTPVATVAIEPAPVTQQDLETNWFDMPSNQ